MNKNKIIYWIATGAMSAMMIMSAGMYFIKTKEVTELFISLGYNGRIVIPLAILKITGVVAILTRVTNTLKEWAYFGFLIDFVLALEGHLAANDGKHLTAIIAIILWIFSYMYDKKVYGKLNWA